jgi:hypothetical protein
MNMVKRQKMRRNNMTNEKAIVDIRYKLARGYEEANKLAEQGGWTAALIALKLRKTFPKKSKKNNEGWTVFCQKHLKRSYKTVNFHIRAAEYLKENVPDWEVLLRKGELPSCSLVGELAFCGRDDQRAVLHAVLFEGRHENYIEFIDDCRDLRRVQAEKKAKSFSGITLQSLMPVLPIQNQANQPTKPIGASKVSLIITPNMLAYLDVRRKSGQITSISEVVMQCICECMERDNDKARQFRRPSRKTLVASADTRSLSDRRRHGT